LKSGGGKGGGAVKRKYPSSDSQRSAVGQAQQQAFATAANHEAGSTAADRRTHGNSSHVAEKDKYKCELCHCFIVNKRQLISQHEDSRKHKEAVEAAAKEKAKIWHCDTCDQDFPATPSDVAEHMNSAEHKRLKVYDNDQVRDGQALAQAQRALNAQAQRALNGSAAKRSSNKQNK
jgi:ribosomal protein L37AE/L43A